MLSSSAGYESGNDPLSLEEHTYYIFDAKLPDLPFMFRFSLIADKDKTPPDHASQALSLALWEPEIKPPNSLPWLKDNLHKPFRAQQPNLHIGFFFMLRT